MLGVSHIEKLTGQPKKKITIQTYVLYTVNKFTISLLYYLNTIILQMYIFFIIVILKQILFNF